MLFVLWCFLILVTGVRPRGRGPVEPVDRQSEGEEVLHRCFYGACCLYRPLC